MRRKLSISILFGLLFLMMGENAKADTFNISWSGPYGAGSGIIDATDEGSGQFLVDSIDATQAGLSLTLIPAGVYGANDNAVYPSAAQQLDFYGLAFSDGSFSYNIYFNAFALTPSYFECVSSSTDCQFVGDGLPIDNFQITPAPEPASMLLLASGLVGLVFVRRKRAA